MLKHVITNAGLLGVSLALLWHLSNIVRYGEQFIREPSPVVLALEVALLAGLVGLSIVNLAKGNCDKIRCKEQQ